MKKPLLFLFLLFIASTSPFAQSASKREFRGAWIASYAGIDWPNKNQTPAQQRAAFISIVDHHKATGINALFIQVRSQCDALYPSELEPWSADLTGLQGRAPSTYWDPMEFMIEECHKRGIEFHAWINPYRAIANYANIGAFAENHVAKTHPEWLLAAGAQRILDPALPEVRNYVKSVIEDIVTRYDVDGIHFDDYFYPNATFNDDQSYQAYSRGFTDKGDWRRDNVNLLVQQVSESIKSIKPWVKFGISPSGIYRNSTNPLIGSNTSGLQHYVTLYADSRKWLQEGWIDYLAPQVYWYINQPGADYKVLIPWWNNNAYGRHIYIGMAGYKVNDPAQGSNWANPSQIPNQVRMNRAHQNIYGQSVYNTSSLRSTTKLGFRDSLRYDFYAKPALLPAMPWRDNTPTAAPTNMFAQRYANDSTVLTWTAPETSDNEFDKVKGYVIYRSTTPLMDLEDAKNILAITPNAMAKFIDNSVPDGSPYYYAVRAIDRFHNESAPSNINDVLAPTIVCTSNQEIVLDANCAAILPDYRNLLTVSDDISTTEQITVSQSPTAGTILSGSGDLVVTFTATDATGKESTCSITVTKKDTQAPVLITRNITRTLVDGKVSITASDLNNGSYDNCGIDATSWTLSTYEYDCSNIGSNTVLVSVMDVNGNSSSAEATVTIEGIVPQVNIGVAKNSTTYTGLAYNTIALGYGAQSFVLTAQNATPEAAIVAYKWSGAPGISAPTAASTSFTPTHAGTYTLYLETTNSYGCATTTSVILEVIDVRCGKNLDKVLVCNTAYGKTGVQICISAEDVADILQTGGNLGSCSPTLAAQATSQLTSEIASKATLVAYPNPFNDQATVEFTLPHDEQNVVLQVMDMHGTTTQTLYRGNATANQAYTFKVEANTLRHGVYIVRLITSEKVYNFKLLKRK